LAALEYDKSQNTNFSYCFTKTLGSSCTDPALSLAIIPSANKLLGGGMRFD
jgi:hypothetical protein